MATLNNFVGFETGRVSDEPRSTSGFPSLSTTTVNSGVYAARMNSGAIISIEAFEDIPEQPTPDQGNNYLVGFAVNFSNTAPAIDNVAFFDALAPSAILSIRLQYRKGTGVLQVLNSSGVVIAGSANKVFQDNTWHYVEMYWKQSAGDAFAVIEVDGVEVINITGQDFIGFGSGLELYRLTNTSNAGDSVLMFADDFICFSGVDDNDDFTKGVEIYKYQAGNTTNQDIGDAVSGGVWSDTGETPYDDGNRVNRTQSTGTWNAGTTFNSGSFPGPAEDNNILGDPFILGAKFIYRCRETTGAGVNKISYGNSTDGLTTENISLNASYNFYFRVSTSGSIMPTSGEYFQMGMGVEGKVGYDMSEMWGMIVQAPNLPSAREDEAASSIII